MRKLKQIFNKLKVSSKHNSIFKPQKKYTMIPRSVYISNLELVERFSPIQGTIVECGTWKGGMIAGIANILSDERTYYLFDSFEGLPPPEKVDGDFATSWQADTESPIYFDNCTASEQDAKEAMSLAGIHNPNIVKGWFQNTLSQSSFPEGIAILRMDGDWYKSTYEILDSLFKQVNTGGLILIDDYYAWEGCAKAVHDFLSHNKLEERINSYNGVCFIQKV